MTGPYSPPPPPPPQLPGSPAKPDRSTLFGILGIVVGFICCPIAGVVLGVLAMRDAKAAGKSPALGIAAIIVSVAATLGWGFFYSSRN